MRAAEDEETRNCLREGIGREETERQQRNNRETTEVLS
jgi:hypothetical protein